MLLLRSEFNHSLDYASIDLFPSCGGVRVFMWNFLLPQHFFLIGELHIGIFRVSKVACKHCLNTLLCCVRHPDTVWMWWEVHTAFDSISGLLPFTQTLWRLLGAFETYTNHFLVYVLIQLFVCGNTLGRNYCYCIF